MKNRESEPKAAAKSAQPGWRRASALPFQKLDDEILVVDPRTRSVHLLNATAARIWELLQLPSSEICLLAALCAEFEAPVDAIRADLTRILGDLAGKGLVGRDEATVGAAASGAEGGGS